jgi:hypothetical protein
MTDDSSLKFDSANKNMTFHKDEFYKHEFQRVQGELIDIKNKLYQTKQICKNKHEKVINCNQKKLQNYKYYKDKTKEYKMKLRDASKQLQKLEIENTRNLLF